VPHSTNSRGTRWQRNRTTTLGHSEGDWYENAHRISGSVASEIQPVAPAILPLSALGGAWLKGFARVGTGSGSLVDAAKRAGFRLRSNTRCNRTAAGERYPLDR
jgi:hypothetical protein